MTATEALSVYLGWLHGTDPPALEFRFEPFMGRHQWFAHWQVGETRHQIGTWAEDASSTTDEAAHHALNECRGFWAARHAALKRAQRFPIDPTPAHLFVEIDFSQEMIAAHERVVKIELLLSAIKGAS